MKRRSLSRTFTLTWRAEPMLLAPLATGFSMLASYLLSSTLVPILSIWILTSVKGHAPADARTATDPTYAGKPSTSEQEKFKSTAPLRDSAFARFQSRYAKLAAFSIRLRWALLLVYLAAAVILIVLVGRLLGVEIFP